MDIQQHIRNFFKANPFRTIVERYDVVKINEQKDLALSVVCTANSRSDQTYFTMTTWNNLALKHNIYIQFVIVEDSEEKDKLDISKLVFSNLNVYYIYIDTKDWVNPCLNYEIGFNYIVADYVVVCNAEVCVFGDIYTIIKQLLTEKRYLMFDVAQTGHSMYQNYDNNQEIYDNYNTLEDKCNSYHKMYSWLKAKNMFGYKEKVQTLDTIIVSRFIVKH